MEDGEGRKNNINKYDFCLNRTFYEFLDVSCKKELLKWHLPTHSRSQSVRTKAICAADVMADLNQMNGAVKAKHDPTCTFPVIIFLKCCIYARKISSHGLSYYNIIYQIITPFPSWL